MALNPIEELVQRYRDKHAVQGIICGDCKNPCPRTGPGQKYCRPCSEMRDLKRKRVWAAANPAPLEYARTKNSEGRERLRSVGVVSSTKEARSITWTADEAPQLEWLVRISFPFTYALSKNHIWAHSKSGHVRLREEHQGARNDLVLLFKQALRGRKPVENKVWIDMLVQKPDHKGDAINVIDGVCDALKEAIGVDDRWFCIRRLDWQVVKGDPHLFVGVGQESSEHVRICSYCGRMRSLEKFCNRNGNRLGKSRECKDCLRDRRNLIEAPE